MSQTNQPESPNTHNPIFLKDYFPPDYLVPEARLHVDLNEGETIVRATLSLEPNPNGRNGAPLTLYGSDQELVYLRLNGMNLKAEKYQREGETLTIPDVPNEPFILQMETKLYPEKNTTLEGLYRSGGVFCTQCEAEGFRKIIFFPDRPDVMTQFQVTLSAPPGLCPVMLSNGNLVGQGMYPDGRYRVTWEDPFPKPAYLFALVAGKLKWIEDEYVTASGKLVTLRIYTEPHNIDKCDHAMESLKKSMEWDEQVYGREYDLELYNIVAVDDFNMGAMENKGLNVFNSKYVLARPETATDTDYVDIEAVIAHEYFHNWTGNRITCRDWFQLSLKEGLTVFRDQMFTADHHSSAVKRIQDVRRLRNHQFAEDAGPMRHPVRPAQYIEINNFYTLTVYEKGAEVVRMQHTLLGAEEYRKATDLYFEHHDGQAVRVEDFVSCMADVSGRDMTQFMRWYNQAGTPQVKASWNYDTSTKTFSLTLQQLPPAALNDEEKAEWQWLHIPITVALLDKETKQPVVLQWSEALENDPAHSDEAMEIVLELTEETQTFEFSDVESDVIPSLLRNFSAPVLLESQHTDEERLFLMEFDDDRFNSWEMGQQLAEQQLMQQIPRVQNGEEPQINAHWLDAWKPLFDRALDDPEWMAEMLTLPSEIWLAEKMHIVDVDAVHTAREATVTALAKTYRDDMVALYQKLDAHTMAGRTLRNVLLRLLARLHDAEIIEICWQQFESAETMTEEMGALVALEQSDSPKRVQALEHFYEKWQGEKLVIDKWFALQASSRHPATLDRIEELFVHDDFELSNPNRVRSLVGAFSHGNPRHFHDVSGRGYQFLADRVLELDATNPQVAARMVAAFNRWYRHDEERQKLMKLQLERIAAKEDLSRDVYEIVARGLKEEKV